jgi:hypothetical protein
MPQEFHFTFDDPEWCALLLRQMAKDIEERSQGGDRVVWQVAIGVIREAATKIEAAVYDRSKQR